MDLSDLIGIPYAAHGRTRGGSDCYGLVRLVLTRYGHALPLFAHDYDPSDREEESRLIDEGFPLIGARKVDAREEGDIVLLRILGSPCHVGVYIGEGRMIHITKGKASCVEPLAAPHLAPRIMGYYRVD